MNIRVALIGEHQLTLVGLAWPTRIDQTRHPDITMELLIEYLLDAQVTACALAIDDLAPRQWPTAVPHA